MRPTSISSFPARRAGHSRTASSRKAAPASSRAWACARSPAKRPVSRIPMRSCCRRSRRRRARRAPSRRGARSAAVQSVLPTCGHRLYLPIDPVASFSSSEKVAWLERVDRETRKMDPRVMQVMASVVAVHEVVLVANSEGTWRPMCARWCVSMFPSLSSRTGGASRVTPARADASRCPSWSRATSRWRWRAKPCARRW